MKNKIKLNNYVRYSVIAFSSILSCILMYLAYTETTVTKTKMEEIVEFNYSASSSIDYKVNIIENSIYNTTVLSSDNTYISALLKNIEINFTHMFEGSRNSEVSGSYNITATITGNVGGENGNILWAKEFVLKPETKFIVNDKSSNITDNANIDYNSFNNICKEINSMIGVSTNDKLAISMNLKYTVKTDKGESYEEFKPSLSIPLNTSYFNITRQNIEEKKGEIKNQASVIIPPNMKKVILYRIIIILLIMLIIATIFATAKPDANDIYIKKIKKVFKTHGTRLVAINNKIACNMDENEQAVHSIDDLVKISDELGKPIIYIYNRDIKKMNSFYVIEDKCTYVYSVDYTELLTGRKMNSKCIANQKNA